MKYRIPNAHRGISIIEVLVSMFILSVGLLGIASLLPLGQRQAALADQQDRLSSLGQNAIRSFRTRGYSNSAFWIKGESNTNPTAGFFTTPILIDPLMAIAQNKGQVPHTGANLFPRYSVKPATTTATRLTAAGAEAIFQSRDDVIVTPGTTPESATTAKFDTAVRRDYQGEYSWAAMIAPTSPGVKPLSVSGYGVPYSEQSCQLSIIVFYRRSLSTLVDKDTISIAELPAGITRERTVNVVSFDGGGIAGGEVTIKPTGAYDAMVKIGEYVLMYQAPSGTIGQSDYKPYRAQWYRVLGADKFVASNNRQITLTGPDWDTSNGYNTPQIIIFDGAVAVYTKSIRLEGPSMWNN